MMQERKVDYSMFSLLIWMDILKRYRTGRSVE
jgi:hypothetical protein